MSGRRRVVPVVLAVIAVAIALALLPTAATAQAPPAGQPPGSPGPRVTILAQPTSVGPSDPFTVFVAIEDAPSAVDLAVDIYDRAEPGDPIGSEPADGPVATFALVQLPEPEDGEARSSAFTIELHQQGEPNPSPAWGHQIDEPGVYPVRIRLRDETEALLATTMTSIIREPGEGQAVAPTQAALLVRAHRPPPADPDVRAAADEADASLVTELGPVLDALRDHPDLPTTLAITPDTARRLAADPSAASTLDRLRDELEPANRTLADGPYVRIDPAELVAGGLDDELTRQRDLGRQALSVLEPPVTGTWPLNGPVDEEALAALRTRGIFQVLLPDRALRSSVGTTAPVDLPAGDGTVRALAATDALTLGRDVPGDPVLAAHRLLARLAVLAEAPSGSAAGDPGAQAIVTIDPALADPASLRLVLGALDQGLPQLEVTTVDAALSTATDDAPAQLASPVPSEIDALVAELREAEESLASYAAMVGGRNEALRPFERSLALSGATDLALDQRLGDAASVSDDLEEPFGAISIPERDTITLATRDGEFPVPITSALDYPVDVVITLDASERVEFPDERIEVTLGRERVVQTIDVRTRGLGDTPVRIAVTSPDGGVLLAEGRYTIRSTAVSSVGIVLTVGAGAFLVLWWGRHWHRNRDVPRQPRGSGRTPTAPPPATDV